MCQRRSLEIHRVLTSKSHADIVRKRFKEILKLPENEKVEFNAHSDSERAGGSSRAKTKMMV